MDPFRSKGPLSLSRAGNQAGILEFTNDVLNYKKLSLYCLLGAVFLAPIFGGRFEFASWALLYILVLLSLILLYARSTDESLGVVTPERRMLFAFLVLSMAATATTVAKQASIIQIVTLIVCYLTFLGGMWLGSTRRETMPAIAIAAAGALLGAAAISEYNLMRPEYLRLAHDEYRVFGSAWGLPGFFNPGFFAGFLAMSLPITLGVYCASGNRWLTVGVGAAWLLQFSALLLTGTRFGAVAALAALLLFVALLLFSRGLTKTTLARLAVLIVLAIVPLILFRGPMFARVAAAHAQSHSLAFRVYTWKATVHIIRDHPLLGIGPGTFGYVFSQYSIAGYTRLAHQSYLQIAAENGVPSLIALLAGIAAALYAAVRGLARRTADSPELSSAIPVLCGFIAAVIGSLIRNLTDSDWYVPGVGLIFFLALGISSAVGRRLSGEEQIVPGSRQLRLLTVAGLLIVMAAVGLMDIATYYSDGADNARERGDCDEFLSYSQEAVRWSPLTAQYKLRLAEATLAMYDNEQAIPRAISYVDAAARLQPTNASIYSQLAWLRLASKDYGRALATFRQAERLDPKSPTIKTAIADLLLRLGRRREALQVYQRMVQIEKSPYEQVRAVPELVDPSYAYAHLELGKECQRQGEARQAAEEFRAVIERLDRRAGFKFMVEQEQAAGGGRDDELRIRNTYGEAKRRLAQLNGPQSTSNNQTGG